MTNRFSNFTRLDSTFQPNPFQPKYPPAYQNENINAVKINKPYEILNADGSLKGYFWYYGNSVDLIFNISDESDNPTETPVVTLLDENIYFTVQDVLKTLQLEAIFYDFRMEPVAVFSNNILAENQLIVDAEKATVKISIDSALSATLTKGTYYLDLIAKHASGYNETLFNASCCTFEIR